VERFLPFWYDSIEPELKKARKVLICAHGNSLRALVKHLDDISDEEIPNLNIPTGIPLIYELDEDLKAVEHYYLGNPKEIAEKIEATKKQAELKK